jgi:hypothetical protein
MGRIHLTDMQWAFICPFLPPSAPTGRPRADDRRTIEGILYVLITGCRWQDLPCQYGAPTTVWRRLKCWGEAVSGNASGGRLWPLSTSRGSSAGREPSLTGRSREPARGGEKIGVTKKGKGTKWMFVVNSNGLPLGFHLDSANTAEVNLAEQTLDTISVSRRRGRPRRRPDKLVADRGYDSNAVRRALRRRGIRMYIPPKRRPAHWRAKRGRPVVACKDDYRLRYTVERSFAELSQLPAIAHPLAASLRRVPQLLRLRRDGALRQAAGASVGGLRLAAETGDVRRGEQLAGRLQAAAGGCCFEYRCNGR